MLVSGRRRRGWEKLKSQISRILNRKENGEGEGSVMDDLLATFRSEKEVKTLVEQKWRQFRTFKGERKE